MTAPIDPLAAARELAAAGIPLFVAPPGSTSTGFQLPTAWPTVAKADPTVVDRWQPGWALCAVMGYGLDVVDLDPRNNGDGMPALPDELQPEVLGLSFTPSGGVHQFIRSLGVRKMGGVFPGIDVQAGIAGEGHGFVFLPPTAKVSKADGLIKPYSWGITVNLGRWSAVAPHAPLAAYITAKKGAVAAPRTAEAGWMADFASAQVGPQSEATANAAIRRELENVTSWTQESGRDFRTTLMRAALTLGGYVGAGHLPAEEADQELTEAAAAVWGEANEDDLTWIRDGLTDGEAKPFRVYSADEAPVAGVAAPQAWGEIDPATLLAQGNAAPLALRGENHQDYAEEVLRYAYPQYRAAVDTGGWVERGSDRWRLQPKDTYAQVIAGAVADNMVLGTKPLDAKDDGPGTYEWRMRRMMRTNGDSKGVGGIVSKMNAIARGPARRGWAAVRVDELDSEKEILWAGGTAWDLRASGHVPTPATWLAGGANTVHLHTAKCAPDSLVPTPYWDKFLAAVWPDPGIRAWALRVLGVALTGYADEVLPVLWGDERTGKSSVATLLMDLLGSYGFAADPRVLTGSYGHASVVFAFKGARMAYIDEGPSGSLDGIERLKQLTGGAPLTGNPMNGNPVSFSPTHTLVMTTNPPPRISDAALRARMRIIPCAGDQTAVRAAREAISTEVWEVEAPGVLAAFMREAAAWLADRGSARTDRGPVEVQVTEGEIAASQDHFAEWMSERTVHDEAGTSTATLYAAFEQWWESKPSIRRRAVPEKLAFGHALKRLGVEKKDTMHAKGWKLRIVTGSDNFSGPWDFSTPSYAPVVTDMPPSSPSSDFPESPKPHDGHDGSHDGPNGVTVMPNTPSSDPVLTENMTVMTVSSPNKVEQKKESNTPLDTPIEGGSSRRGGKEETVSRHTDMPPSAPESPSATQSATPRQLSRTAAAKVRAAAKAEEKAAAKAQKIADAAGPHIGLPAAMRRGEEPRHITLDEAWAIVAACLARTGGRLAVDVENTARPIGHPDYAGRTVQLGDDMEGIDLDLDDADSRELARRACHEASELNAHNATADLAPLAYIDVVDYRAAMSKMVDTAILMKLSNPKDVGNEAGLKDLAPALLGVHALSPAADAEKAELFKAMGCLTEVKPETPLAKNGWAQVDSGCRTMIRYAISDVLDCSAIRRVIPMPDATVLAREQRVQVITSPSALVGVQLDSGRISEQIAERTPVVAVLGRKLAAVGLENANSPKQVNETFAKVGLTLPDTTKETLQKITALHTDAAVKALAQTVLDYRKGSKFMSSFLNPWLEQCEHGDGIVRPTIYTLGADTGRMSCVRPNAQQLPKKGGARECWLAGEGMKIIAGDFSSVEVRVIAALSQDPVLMKMLDDGLKLHDQIALQVFGPGYTETQRTWAKSGVFAHFFGAGIERIAITIQSTMEVAQAVVDAIAIVAPGVHAWTQRVQAQVRAGMSTFTTYSGRVIHLDTKRPYAAVNYMVQGTAREILVDALIKWDDGPYGGGLVLPVHDELLAWVPSGVAEEASLYLEWCLTAELDGVRIMCEMDPPADRWMSAKS